MDLAKLTLKLFQILLMALVAFGVCASEPDEFFLHVFQKELDNRAFAGKVVPALAEHHGDIEQGRFRASTANWNDSSRNPEFSEILWNPF